MLVTAAAAAAASSARDGWLSLRESASGLAWAAAVSESLEPQPHLQGDGGGDGSPLIEGKEMAVRKIACMQARRQGIMMMREGEGGRAKGHSERGGE